MNIDNINYEKKIPYINKNDENKLLKEKTNQFESIIIKILLDESMKSENNLYGNKDPGDKIYNSMYREELSNVSSGQFGLSELLFNYLKNN